jgi:putative ABC transport system substrate-binding protein
MASRRELLIAAAASPLALAARSWAQGARRPVVGYLSPVVPLNNTDFRLEDFRKGMRELGYIEGRNYTLELRWGEGKLERLPALAAELVRLKVDLIVAMSSPSIVAARDATHSIPIVMPLSSDPVGEGLVRSLARPGGNITGLSQMAPELGAKRLQLLREVLSSKSQSVAVLWNPAYKGMRARYSEAERAAPAIGMKVRSLEVRDPREMEAAFEAVARQRPDGLLLLADPLTLSMRSRIVEFALQNRLPAIYETRDFAEAGGLMSYGPNVHAMIRRSAYYVDRILKGAKPADLPIEQPAKIELVVNQRTARQLGLTIPASVLANADQVIE